MKATRFQKGITARKFAAFSLIAVTLFSSSLIFSGASNAYGVETYSKDDKPFGSSLDKWLDKWWTWWITNNVEEFTPKPGGCLMNKSSSMVMLMETTVTGKPHQICEISSS